MHRGWNSRLCGCVAVCVGMRKVLLVVKRQACVGVREREKEIKRRANFSLFHSALFNSVRSSTTCALHVVHCALVHVCACRAQCWRWRVGWTQDVLPSVRQVCRVGAQDGQASQLQRRHTPPIALHPHLTANHATHACARNHTLTHALANRARGCADHCGHKGVFCGRGQESPCGRSDSCSQGQSR